MMIVGALTFAHGVDVAAAGGAEFIDGTPHQTYTEQGIQWVLEQFKIGDAKKIAASIDMTISMVDTLGTASYRKGAASAVSEGGRLAETAPTRLGGSNALEGLRDARNFTPALTQTSANTCGLHCAGQILDEIAPRAVTTLELVEDDTYLHFLRRGVRLVYARWKLQH